MIIDSIENLSLYNGLGVRITKALNYLEETNFKKLDNGRYEIDGANIYSTVNRYATKPTKEGRWEAHKNYIDIQFIAAGAELIGYSFIKNMKPEIEYNSEKDIQFYTGNGQMIKVEKNMFVILFPSDVHMPGIRVNEPDEVIKVVVKVKVQ
jgi:YhcH/YjgK/YiaL family protein